EGHSGRAPVALDRPGFAVPANTDIGISAILVAKQKLYAAPCQRDQELGLSGPLFTLRFLAVLASGLAGPAGGCRLLLRSAIMRGRRLLLFPRVTLLEPAAMKVIEISHVNTPSSKEFEKST